jgi:hypothetical protein
MICKLPNHALHPAKRSNFDAQDFSDTGFAVRVRFRRQSLSSFGTFQAFSARTEGDRRMGTDECMAGIGGLDSIVPIRLAFRLDFEGWSFSGDPGMTVTEQLWERMAFRVPVSEGP